ncbi:hypothetical protein EV175_001325 [Coemansia sp. RSA 1933]|nr:hypothetical protein EV175_001325 [Coemansia sp. RSA 1933]
MSRGLAGQTAPRVLLLLHGSARMQTRRGTQSWAPGRQGRNAYEVLGLAPTCTADEIKQRYYQLCRELHPDTYTSSSKKPSVIGDDEWRAMDAEQRRSAMRAQFVAVAGAYEVLSDPELRRKYAVHKQAAHPVRSRDPWESERPAGYAAQRRQSGDRWLAWSIFGLAGILVLASVGQTRQRLEHRRYMYDAEHQRAAMALEAARERVRERVREVPPGLMREYDAHRPGPEEDCGSLWPYGSGLGLVALLDDSQLCGLNARRQVATDPDVASARDTARRVLASDRIVGRYLSEPGNR